MIAVIARMQVRPGEEANFERAASRLAEAVRANELNNHLYVLARDGEDATKYVMLEQYKSRADLEFHSKSAWFTEAYPAIKGALASKPIIEILEIVGF